MVKGMHFKLLVAETELTIVAHPISPKMLVTGQLSS